MLWASKKMNMVILNDMKVEVSNVLSEKELNEFGKLYLRDIASQYPFSSSETAKQYINNHKGNLKKSISTKNRTIWKGFLNGKIIGYTLVTEKDGQAIKFGPTIIKRNFRGKKFATLLRIEVEKIYMSKGILFAYSTTQQFNKPAQTYVINAGYKKEVILRSHFIPGVSELVFRKQLTTRDISKKDFKKTETLTIHDIYDLNDVGLPQILNESQSPNFKKEERIILNKVYQVFSLDGLSVACLPKKGNSLMIIPLYFELDKNKIANLFDRVFDHYDNEFNLVYTYVPKSSLFEDLLLSFSFLYSGEITKLIDEQLIELSVLAKSI